MRGSSPSSEFESSLTSNNGCWKNVPTRPVPARPLRSLPRYALSGSPAVQDRGTVLANYFRLLDEYLTDFV